jgi:hypothetical protein
VLLMYASLFNEMREAPRHLDPLPLPPRK